MRFSRQQKLGFYKTCIGFGMGMAGQLYIQMPSMGIMPMLDIFSYTVAPVMVLALWPRMGRYMRRSILWGLAWSMAAIFANLVTYYEFRYALKSVVIVSSSWTIMTVVWWLLKEDARIYLWYMVGAAIGGFISLYHFQPGTVACMAMKTGGRAIDSLVEKERYPYYARLLLSGIILPLCILWRKVPSLLAIVGCVASGFYLLFHGGSRSMFGIYAMAGMVGFGVCYMRKTAICLAKHTTLVICLAGILAAVLFGLYAHLAKSGALGERELKKYESEEEVAVETGDSRLANRGRFGDTLEVIKSKPWGEGGTNMRHSVISNSLNCEGFVGFAFWVYFFSCLLWFCKNRVVYSGTYSVFFMSGVIGAIWSVLGSPFGARAGYFTVMAFIALCRDNPMYGAGTVFYGPEMPIRREGLR